MKKILINPPPSNKRCECCNKESKDLKPFGKAGDPLVGDFDGASLIKTYRSMALELTGSNLKKYKKKCTEEQFSFYEQLCSTIEASWECRECIVLIGEEYFKKKGEIK